MTKLRLSEDPREWRKFGLSLAAAGGLLLGLLAWRGAVASDAALRLAAAPALLALLALAAPPALRPVYRGGLRLGHALGQVVGRVLLALVFVLVLVPLGLLLRLLGKDLLARRRPPPGAGLWHPARPRGDLERLF
jgi:hypothetical protein